MSEPRCTIENTNQFWSHYLSLENSLKEISEYISIHEKNYKSYSFKNMQLFFAVCTDIDSVLKHIRSNLNLTSIKQPNMRHHREMLSKHFSIISDSKIFLDISNEKLTFRPFELLSEEDKAFEWWSAYNDVKHQRPENFHQANIKNLLNALAALHILNLVYAISSKEEYLSGYENILIQASALRNYPILQFENSGVMSYIGGYHYYACRLNAENIYKI
ncbi:hypothetical protein [Psychrobacter sp. S4(2024)]|uniref:hypothetical protein n=1 Tax=Psychrobacter sp. S4(2024) TaxID=3111913 RepID=UPI002FDF3BFE|tara:strand:- start:32 stop:685 length:654 start_codon:yes stop_codon:yes gene_type:complete